MEFLSDKRRERVVRAAVLGVETRNLRTRRSTDCSSEMERREDMRRSACFLPAPPRRSGRAAKGAEQSSACPAGDITGRMKEETIFSTPVDLGIKFEGRMSH